MNESVLLQNRSKVRIGSEGSVNLSLSAPQYVNINSPTPALSQARDWMNAVSTSYISDPALSCPLYLPGKTISNK